MVVPSEIESGITKSPDMLVSEPGWATLTVLFCSSVISKYSVCPEGTTALKPSAQEAREQMAKSNRSRDFFIRFGPGICVGRNCLVLWWCYDLFWMQKYDDFGCKNTIFFDICKGVRGEV